jgi:hypothetical protein
VRRAAVRVAAALVAVVAAVGPAGPARAGFDEWKRIPCTSGAIDYALLANGGKDLTLEWHLDCVDGAEQPARFGYARFNADGVGQLPGAQLTEYAPTAPTLYERTALLPASISAICVVTDYDVRVACVKVDRGGPAVGVTVRPLPVDDPLVIEKPGFIPPDMESSPACGGCW